jgi:hypothetical protein
MVARFLGLSLAALCGSLWSGSGFVFAQQLCQSGSLTGTSGSVDFQTSNLRQGCSNNEIPAGVPATGSSADFYGFSWTAAAAGTATITVTPTNNYAWAWWRSDTGQTNYGLVGYVGIDRSAFSPRCESFTSDPSAYQFYPSAHELGNNDKDAVTVKIDQTRGTPYCLWLGAGGSGPGQPVYGTYRVSYNLPSSATAAATVPIPDAALWSLGAMLAAIVVLTASWRRVP